MHYYHSIITYNHGLINQPKNKQLNIKHEHECDINYEATKYSDKCFQTLLLGQIRDVHKSDHI